MRWFIIALISLIPTSVLAAKKPPPKKQERCGSAEQAIKGLKDSFGEIPFAILQDSAGHDLIMFVSPQTWTWTIMQDTHDKKFCAVANGTDFRPATKSGIGKIGVPISDVH